jgi:hypothetical protein
LLHDWIQFQFISKGTSSVTIDDSIKPFQIIHHDNSMSLVLEAGWFQQQIFDERAKDGFRGDGYDWASLAHVFLDERMPQLKAHIRFDPEADMFCVYSPDRSALEAFALSFHAACSDERLMRDLLSRAQLD